ncbi:MAG: ABC transporter ATP-binding protein [Thermoanaerobacteraceae bacterium]
MEILEIANISKKLSKRTILDNISFSVSRGDIYGLIGPNGAGKTTTLKIITGLMKPDQGRIIINGFDLSKNHDEAISNIGAIIENPSLYEYLSGIDNLKIVAKMRSINYKELDKIIDIIGLKDRINDKVKKYSLGMKQRLAIGCAIVSSPKVLILDEPTNGLDPTGIIELREFLKILSTKDTTILISSHQLSEIEQICNKVAFINNGKILMEDSVENILKNKINLEEKYIELITKG